MKVEVAKVGMDTKILRAYARNILLYISLLKPPSKISGSATKMLKFEFLICLVVLKDLLSNVNPLVAIFKGRTLTLFQLCR